MTAVRDFEELRIRVRQIGAERYLVLVNGATHGVRAVRAGAGPAEFRDEFNRLIAIETGGAPAGSTNTSDALRRLGRSVYDLLFDDALTACVRRAREEADRQGRGLRLCFDLPPALHALPVEALCSPAEHPEQTFALQSNLSIARSLSGSVAKRRLPTGDDPSEVLRLLVAVATPGDLPHIDAEAELAELRELPGFVVRTDIIRHATLADIESWLKANADGPTAVLLIAHGNYSEDTGDGVIILETKDGAAAAVPGQLLSGIFVGARRLRLVVLNLCFSAWNSAREPFAGLAQAMVGGGIPAVVAMPGLVTDRAAGVFGPKLLTGICVNRPVDEAMTSARQHIANMPGHTAIEWATPRLFLHEACGHGWLFKAREVREDDDWADPLRIGEEAREQVNASGGDVNLATAFTAVRFLRLRRDWREAESIAKALPPAEQTPWLTEARLELAWKSVEVVCAALTDANHALAQQHLDKIRGQLPDPVVVLLTREIQEVALAERYTLMQDHHQAGRWKAALAEGSAILAVRENGYRDTVSWVGYLTGRVAEVEARWADAVRGYASCQGFADATGRLAHARGHVDAGLGNWAAAENHFRAATELGVGEDYLAEYAAARAAEDASDWDSALRRYTELPDTVRDVVARRRFARGILADLQGDWADAIDNFGALPDDFADGEAGRRRRFAEAKLAEGRADWVAVLNLLGDTDDAFRGGSAGVLRWKARGRLAEADGDWAQAAKCYGSVTGSAELDLAKRYATARLRECEGEWSTALETYVALPRDHRDVELRSGYARARVAELALDWAHALELYAALPDDFEDVKTRQSYATLRVAIAERRWMAAADEAGRLGDYLDAAILGAYARGRLAEQRADWAGASFEYVVCGDYADAASRAAYARGRVLDAAGHWSKARTAYGQVVTIVRDVRRRRAWLDFLLAELPFADGIADASLVADPVALRERTFPYLALSDAGVTPASPTQVVTDAPFVLMERGALIGHERMAWDRLRTPAKRLRVDARMYWLREPHALRRTLAALGPATGPDPLAWLCARLPADAPLLMLLAGQRDKAMALWRQRLAVRPDDQDDVHCLGLASFWHAQELEEAGAWGQAAQVWRTALACLATLLTDDEFWVGWRQNRAECYGHPVTPARARLLRVEFGRHLIDVLTSRAERHADAGREPEADRYRELVSLFEAELDAAQCLHEAGGLPLRGGDGRLSCGPEYLRLAGLVREFGEFVAAEHQAESAGGEARQQLLGRLRCAFSALSTASSSIDRHRFESALRELPEYHRMRRTELPEDCAGPARHGGVDDCEHCREFLARDPAYTFLADRRFRLLRDAVGLAMQARLSIARGLLTGRQLDAAIAELGGAIDVAANALIGARARDAVLKVIVGRVDALAGRGVWERGGLDEAIELVEKAVAVFGDPIRRALTPKLADLLVYRGLRYRAAGDLRRAFELGPGSPEVRCDLAVGLIRYSGERRAFADALALLIDALHGIDRAFDQAGTDGLLEKVLAAVEDVLLVVPSDAGPRGRVRSLDTDPAPELTGAAKARAFAGEAARRRADGDLIGCALCLVWAVRADPLDERYRIALRTTLEDLVTVLREGEPARD